MREHDGGWAERLPLGRAACQRKAGPRGSETYFPPSKLSLASKFAKPTKIADILDQVIGPLLEIDGSCVADSV